MSHLPKRNLFEVEMLLRAKIFRHAGTNPDVDHYKFV